MGRTEKTSRLQTIVAGLNAKGIPVEVCKKREPYLQERKDRSVKERKIWIIKMTEKTIDGEELQVLSICPDSMPSDLKGKKCEVVYKWV